MDFQLDDDQTELRAAIRRFLTTEVAPLVEQHERAQTFPFDVLGKLAPFGYLGGYLPEDEGGLGISRVTWAMMMEELGYCWPSLRTMVSISNGPAERLAQVGTRAQRDRYLAPLLRGEEKVFTAITEPDSGSDVSSITTKAELQGDEWVLTGQKLWITGGLFADWGTVLARTFSPTCDGALSTFIVDRRDTPFSVSKVETMVLQSTGTSEMAFDGVRLPKENLLGPEGSALKGTLAFIGPARINVAMGAVGAAQRAYELSLDYAKNRQQFGRPIASFQLIQQHIVGMRMKIDAARALCYAAAAALDRGESGRVETSIAKLYATQAAHEVADAAMAVHGGLGYATEYPIERLFRDTRGGSIPEGTPEIQTLIIGRELLGISAIR
ncbi:acyl-CoA dehydrogenase family protein [Nocardioides sp.]|uniref:acyl-CoA dehydrogenase family protein n=1 Tax=Nocardioides sp. TaxID=35761 RepID=UPI003D0CE3B6